MFQLCSVIQEPGNRAQRCEYKSRVLFTKRKKGYSRYTAQYRNDQPNPVHLMLTGKLKSIEPGA